MKEELLHYAWRTRQYNPLQLSTTDQQPVQVIHPGRYNLDAGPDFLEAKIKIGDTLWVGHVEIHVLASDWNKHFHADDPKYRNVILHVVYDADTDAAVTGRDHGGRCRADPFRRCRRVADQSSMSGLEPARCQG